MNTFLVIGASTGAVKIVSSSEEIQKKLKRRRTWQPLDNHNSAYQELLLARRSLSVTDHIEQNIVSSNTSIHADGVLFYFQTMVNTASDQVRSDRGPIVGRRQRAWTLGENEVRD